MKKTNVGIFLFPNMTMIDGYAPLQFFAFVDSFETFTFAKTKDPVPSDCGSDLVPTYGFENCPKIDVLVIPGGGNTLSQMKDPEVLAFIRNAGASARYITAVCTGSLILAEAGLLDGYRAATHWGYREVLAAYEKVTLVDDRVVIDRNRITGGGVTAGLDFALTVIAEVVDEPTAHGLQLMFEYRPKPPFNSGGPETASPEAVAGVQQAIQGIAGDLWDHVRSRGAAS